MRPSWAALCAEAAAGGLSALANAPLGALLRNPDLRRLLTAVADETATALRKAGLPLASNPARLAARMCRENPRRIHPWLKALRAGKATGAGEVFGPLLKAARKSKAPAEKLFVIAAVLRRLEKKS